MSLEKASKMKKGISNQMCIISLSDVINNSIIPDMLREMPQGSQRIICKSKIKMEQTSYLDSDGLRWDISATAVTTDSSVQNIDSANNYLAVILTDGSIRVLGLRDYVPTVIVTSYEQETYMLSVSYQALKPIEL